MPSLRITKQRWSWIRGASYGFTALTMAFLIGIIGLFLWQSLPVWQHAGASYITGERWYFRKEEFGALPMIYGTFVVSLVALMLAAPIGIGTALFTSEVLSKRLRLPRNQIQYACRYRILTIRGEVSNGLQFRLSQKSWQREGPEYQFIGRT